jgi:dienelactone hydrolase
MNPECWLLQSITRALLCGLAFLAVACPGHEGTGENTTAETNSWEALKPFFDAPPEFRDQFGPYRSPLRFENGTMVRIPRDWARRRVEILAEWQKLMGPWPRLLAKPKLEILSENARDDFIQRRVRLQIAREQTGEAWLLVPNGKGPFPAVLVLYYEPETSIGISKEPLRDFGYQLARRGFVTLSIGTPGGNAWKPDIGRAHCQPLSFHAYVSANCWQALANLLEVDRSRIGVVGHSYGGKWAMFAGALWDKFAAVAVSDPGVVFDETRPNVNYWEPWYLGLDKKQQRPKAGLPSAENPRTGAYKLLVEEGHDLHELHSLIAPRPFLVSGGSEDPPARWLALNHLRALDRLLGYTNRVGLTSRPGHTPTPESNNQIYAFFEHFLKESHEPVRALNP